MKNFLLRIFTWWNGHTIGTNFYLWRKGERVGEDEAGNVYYRAEKDTRRMVMYNGEADASKIPAGWPGCIIARMLRRSTRAMLPKTGNCHIRPI